MILFMLRACVGMMKIAGDKFAITDHQIAGENVKILRTGMEMSGITRAWVEFAQHHRVATVALQRQ